MSAGIYKYTRTHVSAHKCTLSRAHTHTHTHTHTHIHSYTHTHAHAQMHTHTCTHTFVFHIHEYLDIYSKFESETIISNVQYLMAVYFLAVNDFI